MGRSLYLHGSMTGELRFFWNAEEHAYPYMPATRIDYSLIDEGVAELVRKINGTTWALTVSSCEGHPEQDNNYCAHPEIWIRVFDGDGLLNLFDWLERANKVRQQVSVVYKSDRLIDAEFVGKTGHGYYFCIYGKFVNVVENKRIIDALVETL